MNKKAGMYASVITFIAVFAFAVCMLLEIVLDNNIGQIGNYFSSILIAFGFIAMMCTFFSFAQNQKKSIGLLALSFSIMYGIMVIVVYFTQLTTVRLSKLSNEMVFILDYLQFGLFFNYDLLGYMFMAMSTFFMGIILETKNRQEKLLKRLLCIHGIFAISCFAAPILGVFDSSMAGEAVTGTILLEIWCMYFMPICILSYKYFKNIKET
jgi:hypothetical protein